MLPPECALRRKRLGEVDCGFAVNVRGSLKPKKGQPVASQVASLHGDVLAEGGITSSESNMFDKLMDDASRLASSVVSPPPPPPPSETTNQTKNGTAATKEAPVNASRLAGW